RAAGFVRGFRLGLAPSRYRFEGRRNVGHLLDALADAGDVGQSFGPARAGDIDGSRLVPIDAVRSHGIVEDPALVLDPLHARLAALVHDRLRNALHEIPPWSLLAA